MAAYHEAGHYVVGYYSEPAVYATLVSVEGAEEQEPGVDREARARIVWPRTFHPNEPIGLPAQMGIDILSETVRALQSGQAVALSDIELPGFDRLDALEILTALRDTTILVAGQTVASREYGSNLDQRYFAGDFRSINLKWGRLMAGARTGVSILGPVIATCNYLAARVAIERWEAVKELSTALIADTDISGEAALRIVAEAEVR